MHHLFAKSFAGFLLLSAPALQAGDPQPGHHPIVIHDRRGTMVNSTNWSGYAVTGPSGSVSDVKGSWVVPAIQNGCSAGATNQYAAFWVGIDGFNGSTVEQIGTDSDCQNGAPVYYAWFEFYPHPSYIVNSLAIRPGDVIAAEVRYSGGRFTVSLKNNTTGQSFSTSTKVNGAARSSAEWIAEAPSSQGGVLRLADFASVSFGQDYTPVASTCDATIGSTSGAIGSFPGASVYQISMVTSAGTPKAAPSALTTDGSSFTDTWYSPGP